MSLRPAFLTLALLAAGSAAAQTRPSSVDMTCAAATRLVLDRGALVMGTGGQTFDRFVRDRSFCENTEIATRAFVPTRDVPQCLVGYRCREPSASPFDDE